MKQMLRKWLSVMLSLSLLYGGVAPQVSQAAAPPLVEPSLSIDDLLQEHYLELLQIAPTISFTAEQYQQVRKRLEREEKAKKDELKRTQKDMEKQVEQAQEELKRLSKNTSSSREAIESRRHDLHCRIQSLQKQLAEIKVAREHGVPVEYENLQAKLELLEKWPAEQRTISRQLETGEALARRWGDVEDIGFRTIQENQEDDIKDGQEAVRQMKQLGLLPPEVEDEQVVEYVRKIARSIAVNSDLKVPLQVSVLNSKEINAFALPGGFFFINQGLILAAESEAQLAGVIAHEISHDVARHGHRLMKKATIASLLYQAAQIGALILTGGVAGIGTYYALQYGFYGLGLALNLQLLGVSREFEQEADQLGVQYVWKAGYDPQGFIQFFDIMASKEGYVEKTSFFRTHPAFYDRIVGVFREISFLPKKDRYVQNTDEFGNMQQRLKQIAEDLEKEEKDRPSLLQREPGCPDEIS